jgi:hypothetical protein
MFRSLLSFAKKNNTMKQIALRYGIIAGIIVGTGLLLSMFLFKMEMLNMDYGAVFGYTTQLIAFSAIFFGVKKFRDQVNGGLVSFGKALGIGLLISLIAGLIYCITWEVYFQATDQQFIQEYSTMYLEKLKSSGSNESEISAAQQEMAQFADMYRNPLVRFGFTLMEIIPMGLLISLITALVLKKNQKA